MGRIVDSRLSGDFQVLVRLLLHRIIRRKGDKFADDRFSLIECFPGLHQIRATASEGKRIHVPG